jgi:hypothetical protein
MMTMTMTMMMMLLLLMMMMMMEALQNPKLKISQLQRTHCHLTVWLKDSLTVNRNLTVINKLLS